MKIYQPLIILLFTFSCSLFAIDHNKEIILEDNQEFGVLQRNGYFWLSAYMYYIVNTKTSENSKTENSNSDSIGINSINIYRTSELSSKLFFTYNRNNKIVSASNLVLKNDKWEELNRMVITYDDKGKVLKWDYKELKKGNWITVKSVIFSYDKDNRINSKLLKEYPYGINNLLLEWKNTIVYDNQGNKISDLLESYNDAKWEFNHKKSYKYDSLNRKIFEKDTSASENCDIYYSYNQYGKINIKIIDFNLNDWFDEKVTYIYDDKSNLITELKGLLESYQDGKGVDSIQYKYDDNINLIEKLHKTWNWRNQEWCIKEKIVNEYDERNNHCSKITSVWSRDGLIEKEREKKEYNKDNKLTTFIYEYKAINTWEEQRSPNKFEFEDDYGNFFAVNNFSKIEIEWGKIVPEPETTEQNITSSASPNPFYSSTDINFKLEAAGEVTVEVFDEPGNILMSVKEFMNAGNNKVTFKPENLPSGVYYYKIKSGAGTASGKIIYVK